jgi:hypothetical protein
MDKRHPLAAETLPLRRLTNRRQATAVVARAAKPRVPLLRLAAKAKPQQPRLQALLAQPAAPRPQSPRLVAHPQREASLMRL